MDSDFPNPPRYSVGRELATSIACCGILTKAWKAISSISKNGHSSFLLIEDEGVVIVAFPSFHNEDCTAPDSKYGECNIQNEKIFGASLRSDDAKPALVHKEALNRFLHILESSDFKAKIESLKEQTIVFVGHSVGGAVAALATLWFLDKRFRNSSSFCITFGSPLIGNAAVQEAIGREDWSGRFCHVVSKYDIVPRMHLAPLESITGPLNAILPHWRSKMGHDHLHVSHLPYLDACRILLENVLNYTSTIANNYPGGSGFRSPFVPFGTYMFCSSHGAACIEDSEAVLKMLHLTIRSQEAIPDDQIAHVCISEHTDYDSSLEIISDELLKANQIANFVANSSFELGIALELQAMGLEAQDNHAFLALKKAGEEKNEQDTNLEILNMELSKNQSYMAQLEWYKMRCKEDGPGYYDAFKQSVDKKDFYVNLARKRLEEFWDKIVEMEEKHVLPSDFRTRNKWINAGTAYRKLVEPLDIAYHYRTDKENKSYLSEGFRPHRHVALEKWMKDKEQTRTVRGKKDRTNYASLTEDSVFWARLEEVYKALISPQQEFEKYVGIMIKVKSISTEVFLGQSSFMIWWQQYSNIQLQTPVWTSSSPLFEFMAKEGWNQKA